MQKCSIPLGQLRTVKCPENAFV